MVYHRMNRIQYNLEVISSCMLYWDRVEPYSNTYFIFSPPTCFIIYHNRTGTLHGHRVYAVEKRANDFATILQLGLGARSLAADGNSSRNRSGHSNLAAWRAKRLRPNTSGSPPGKPEETTGCSTDEPVRPERCDATCRPVTFQSLLMALVLILSDDGRRRWSKSSIDMHMIIDTIIP